MLTVSCVFKPGAGFTAEYVYRLRLGILKNLTIPHRFFCYTDQKLNEHIETLPLAGGQIGWFNKASLWLIPKPEPGPMLYFDLDTMIIGNIDKLAQCPRTALLNDVIRVIRSPEGRFPQSGIMYLEEPALAELKKNQPKDWSKFSGDATYIGRTLPGAMMLQDWVPGQICSWRCAWNRGIRDPDTRVLCFHGKPRPHEVKWDPHTHWTGMAMTLRPPGLPGSDPATPFYDDGTPDGKT